jgi:hypothetical protein
VFHLFGYHERIDRSVVASTDRDGCVPVGAGQEMDAVERLLVQAKDQAGAKTEWTIRVLHCATDYLNSNVELANTILGFAAGLLVRIGNEFELLGDAVPVAGHGRLFRLAVNLLIGFSNHFPRDLIVLNVGVAIDEALALLAQLCRRHLNLAHSLNELI